MANIQEKVKKALLKTFSENELRLEAVEDDKVMGFIVSNKFSNLDDETRQDMIWELLGKYLNLQELTRIIILITLTQEEEMAYSS